ncbi:MAG: hypothetical protein BWY19_00253 [bacterium ADurb.Bin212]|nr:MAG: hypothetical protein BWY19_00253 [bacterium ADurb.Bin212]
MISVVGKWSFLAGLIISIVAGFFDVPFVLTILAVVGLAVGFLNITQKKSQQYLVAVIALLIIGSATIQAFSALGALVGVYTSMLTNMIAFVAASGIVVAIKEVLSINRFEEIEQDIKGMGSTGK